MKTYKLNNIDISEDQIRALIKSHPELKEEKSGKPWRAEHGGGYLFVTSGKDKERNLDTRDEADDYRYLTGNYFKTQASADVYLARQEAIGRVTHAILEANGELGSRYWVVYAPYNKLDINWFDKSVDYGQVLPKISSEEIANQIIKDHEADLKLIFNLN